MSEAGPARKAGSRRRLILGGLGFAAAYAGLRVGIPAVSERLAPLDLEPLDRPAGFRRLVSAGGASGVGAGAFDPLVGLEPADRVAPSCAGLFGDGPDPGPDPGTVPVAYFSDANCAYCRVLTPRLDGLDGVRVTLHELPILGDGSVYAARAAVAAGAQGAHAAFHAALMDAPRPSPATIERIAGDLGLDVARLRADMGNPAVDVTLKRSDALAALFGIRATPALVVGRTLVIGAISRVTLDRLVAREAADGTADGAVPACA